MRQRRKEQVLKRKNFFPTLIVTIFLWLVTAGLIYFIDPDIFGAVPLFFIFIFLTLLFTFSLIFADTRRGLVATLGTLLFLLLAYLGIGNFLNLVLIAAIVVASELYFSFK